MRNLISRFCDFYLRRPLWSGLVAMVLLAASVYFAYQVKINSNQLDLLPSDLPEVIEARRVTDMIAGRVMFW